MGVLGVGLFLCPWLTSTTISFDSKTTYPLAAGLPLGVGMLSFACAMPNTDMSKGATAAIATSNAAFATMLAFLIFRGQIDLTEWIGIPTIVVGIVILRI